MNYYRLTCTMKMSNLVFRRVFILLQSVHLSFYFIHFACHVMFKIRHIKSNVDMATTKDKPSTEEKI
jgi:hypothetical protein